MITTLTGGRLRGLSHFADRNLGQLIAVMSLQQIPSSIRVACSKMAQRAAIREGDLGYAGCHPIHRQFNRLLTWLRNLRSPYEVVSKRNWRELAVDMATSRIQRDVQFGLVRIAFQVTNRFASRTTSSLARRWRASLSKHFVVFSKVALIFLRRMFARAVADLHGC
jgi:hypothetical protein